MTTFDSYLLKTRRDLQELKAKYETLYGKEKAEKLIERDIANLKKSPSPMVSDRQLKMHKEDLQSFYKYVKAITDREPDITNKELSARLHDFFQTLNIHFANSPSIRSDSIRVDICSYYAAHQREFIERFREIKKQEKESGEEIRAPEILTYSSNAATAKDQFMSQIITTFRDIKNSFNDNIKDMLEYYCSLSPKQKRDYLEKAKQHDSKIKQEYLERKKNNPDLEEEEPVSLVRFIKKNYIFFLPEEEGAFEFLKGNEYQTGQYRFLSSELRKDYVEMILSTLKILDDFGFLDTYIDDHNKQVEAIGLPDLKVTREEFEKAYSGLLEDSKSDAPVLSMHQYSVLNSFWINRLTHELIDFNSAYFTVESLDLWEEIRDAETRRKTSAEIISEEETDIDDYHQDDVIIDVHVSDDELRAVLENRRFVSAILSDLYSAHLTNISTDELVDKEFEDPQTGRKYQRRSAVIKNIDDHFKEISDDVEEEYKDYFGKLFGLKPSEMAPLFNDIYILSSGQNATHNSFALKTNMQIAQMSNLYNALSFAKNWGLYLEGRKNPLECEKIIIAMDVPGFNMPIRLHVQRQLVEDFLKANQGTTKIPLYQGERDFYKRIDGKKSNISTPLLLPLDEREKAKFVETLKRVPTSSRYYNFARHLIFTATGADLPDHMKDEGKGKKKGKKRFVERFFDFADGKIYVKAGNDQFKEDPNYVLGGTEHAS